jgi:hypothetical protein
MRPEIKVGLNGFLLNTDISVSYNIVQQKQSHLSLHASFALIFNAAPKMLSIS